jgi:hypothetical protein
LTERLDALRRQMRELQAMARAVADARDHQVSLTDPDARAMATNGKGTGMVGYNVQTIVDAKHHLIIAHEVTNVGPDKLPAGEYGTAGKGGDRHGSPDRPCESRLLLRRASRGLWRPPVSSQLSRNL